LLTVLDLEENNIPSLPLDALFSSSRVERINLFNNKLDKLDGSLLNLASLKVLDVRGNPCTCQETKEAKQKRARESEGEMQG
jgi:Leucine-rich repeat (LRR) protein